MGLSFGVEIELLVCPRDRAPAAFKGFMTEMGWDPAVDSVQEVESVSFDTLEKRAENRYALRYAIASSLTTVGLPAVPEKDADYQSWSILDEEIDEIPRFFDNRLLHARAYLPDDDTYTSEQLRGICKALSYFDDAITKVMPPERKVTTWAKSNYTGNGKYLLDKVTPKHVHDQLSGQDERRYLSWNFENVTAPCGTIEFRRPPGVNSAPKAIHWAAFALGFVSMAQAYDWASIAPLTTLGSVAELQSFITQGLERLGPTYSDALSEPIVEDISPPIIPTAAEVAVIEQKLKAKKKKSPFVEKDKENNKEEGEEEEDEEDR
ncbi:hypothetical protein N658DRAFT_488032 [Parathielavia hyrcaniae]|uniref:Uncharacterized protein n=1 Tax=Parathielavia hyrcaniae TaxID=113614 RepID=A0AAN6SZ15_9PEZI|nr:hypothetical protein N658DRAFT_488032 [Parathielavia hyrcaniae]